MCLNINRKSQIPQNSTENKDKLDNNTRWSNIVNICLKTGEEVFLGPKAKNKKSKESQEIKILSNTKQRL